MSKTKDNSNTKNVIMGTSIEEVTTSSSNRFMKDNKTGIISSVAVIFALIIGFGVYQNQKEKKISATAQKIYHFERDTYAQLVDKKLQASQYIEKLDSHLKETNYFSGNLNLIIKSIDQLKSTKNLSEVKEILTRFKDQNDNDYTNFFLSMSLASVHEDLGEYNQSAQVLEELLKSPLKLMEMKIYLDLGRNYLALGKTEEAKKSLHYVIDNSSEGILNNMARAILSEIK